MIDRFDGQAYRAYRAQFSIPDIQAMAYEDWVRKQLADDHVRGAAPADVPALVVADGLRELGQHLAVPDGLCFRFHRDHELTWFDGAPGRSMSAWIRPEPGSETRVNFLGEIRVFLHEPYAVLFAHETDAIGNWGRDLLPGQNGLVQASTHVVLMTKIGERIAPVLKRFQQEEPTMGMKP